MSSPYVLYDGARVSRESDLGKELSKWDQPNYNPDATANRYPKMLFKAAHRPDGKRSVGETRDALFAQRDDKGNPLIVAGAAEQWSRNCQKTVKDESEFLQAYGLGWRATPQEALDLLQKEDEEMSNITAGRHAADLKMSTAAQAEAAAVDASTLKHVPAIPEAPTKRKYTRKAQPAA